MGRMQAKRTLNRAEARKRMKNISILNDPGDLIDETKYAYKDISEITDAVVGAGIARVVAKVEPLGVVKGLKKERKKKK
jgi:tRNA-splicing ligase RtcB